MRIISIRGILVASFIIGFAVTSVSAQQMPLGPGSGYPQLMGMMPPPTGGSYPGSMCAPPPPPVKCAPPCAPTPNMGCTPFPCFDPYACPPPPCSGGPSMEPSVFVGYLYKDYGAGTKIHFEDGNLLAGISSMRNDFTLQGVWLELAAPVALSQNAGLFFSVAHLFPVQATALESYGALVASRQWNTDIQWWEMDAGLAYRLCPAFTGLAGFRWSSFLVDFGQPTNQQNFSTSPDQAQLSVNAYIPFLGLASEHTNCNTSLKAAFLGFPVLPSDVEFQETLNPTGVEGIRFSGATTYKSGYFYEALVEASTKMGAWSLGALVRFDAIHTNRSLNFTSNGSSLTAAIQFDRREWIFGGKIGFVF